MHNQKDLENYVKTLPTYEILQNIYSDYSNSQAYIKELHDRGGNVEAVRLSVNGMLKRIANEVDNK